MEPIPHRAFRRFRTQTAQLAVAQIDAMHLPTLTFGVKRIAIRRIEEHVKSVTTGERGPIRVANCFLTRNAAWPDPVFIILQTARDPEIRFRIVQTDPIEFAARKFVQVVPVFPPAKL